MKCNQNWRNGALIKLIILKKSDFFSIVVYTYFFRSFLKNFNFYNVLLYEFGRQNLLSPSETQYSTVWLNNRNINRRDSLQFKTMMHRRKRKLFASINSTKARINKDVGTQTVSSYSIDRANNITQP